MSWRGTGGLNDYAVTTIDWTGYDRKEHRAFWLGGTRFRCGKCKKGYFDVRNPNDHDEQCPECRHKIVVSWISRD